MIYTYDVNWVPSSTPWTHRWDMYLKGNPDDEIHYFSIVNSLMIVLFLTGVVAMIMMRTLRKDISTCVSPLSHSLRARACGVNQRWDDTTFLSGNHAQIQRDADA